MFWSNLIIFFLPKNITIESINFKYNIYFLKVMLYQFFYAVSVSYLYMLLQENADRKKRMTIWWVTELLADFVLFLQGTNAHFILRIATGETIKHIQIIFSASAESFTAKKQVLIHLHGKHA
jgi:hypothetical protein